MRKAYIFPRDIAINKSNKHLAKQVTEKWKYKELRIAYNEERLRCVDPNCLESLIIVHIRRGVQIVAHFRHHKKTPTTPPCDYRT